MYVLLIAILMQAAIITAFSAQVSAASSAASLTILDKIEGLIGKIDWKFFDLHIFIRKAAHFYNFAIIGMLVFCSWYCLYRSRRKLYLWALLGLFTAVFDEIHQYFVPGRSAQVGDVLIDFSGTVFGICFLYAAICILFRKKRCSLWITK